MYILFPQNKTVGIQYYNEEHNHNGSSLAVTMAEEYAAFVGKKTFLKSQPSTSAPLTFPARISFMIM